MFVERCLDLLKPEGRLGIVLPDGLLGNPGDGYIRQYINEHAQVRAVVDCPVETFMPHTGTKTSVLILHKKPVAKRNMFFAIAEHCGHTMRGKPTGKSDFKAIASNYCNNRTDEHLGFHVQPDNRLILVPRYYDPRIVREIKAFDAGEYEMKSIGELVDDETIEVKGIQGCPSSDQYDLHGKVRFIRTSDIASFEVAQHTQKNIAMETYEARKVAQDLQKGDILFVKDGDTKIGECAILLSDEDLEISVQSHFKKIRPLKISAYMLLWALNTSIVKKQIRQRVFSQSTLSTIGERINELKLPLPRSIEQGDEIIKVMKNCIRDRREKLKKLIETLSRV